MKPDIKDRWTWALRSGEYRQGTRFLHRKDGTMCCLGVLCDLYAKENSEKWEDNETVYDLLGKTKALPIEVQQWAGLNNGNPRVTSHNSLTELNDDGASFEVIADIIEKEL